MDICVLIDNNCKSITDWVLELRYEMVEDVGNDLGEQIDWVDSTISVAVENKSYGDLAALAMLRQHIELEVQEMRAKL